jgi:hypothetical protein
VTKHQEDLLLGLQQEDTLAMPCKDAPLLTNHQEDLLLGLQQEDTLVTPRKEAYLVSKQQEVCQLNIGVGQQLEGNSIDREHYNETACDLERAPSDVAGTDYAPYFS